MTQSPKGQKAKPKRKEKLTDKAQSERFIEAARQAEIEDNSEKFEATFSKMLLATKTT